MKTRVTFRVESALADSLRELPNQTKFVEDALRDALGKTCPVCNGEGRVATRRPRVTNLREQGVKRLSRGEARELQRVFRLGREVAATRLELQRAGRKVTYSLRRNSHELLSGVLSSGDTRSGST